jgi:tyrosine-protein kinase Etk/Wzc
MSDAPSANNPPAARPVGRGVSLLEIFATLLKHRWLFLGIAGGIAVLTLAFLFATSIIPVDSPWNLLPDKYAPTVRVLLQESTDASSSISQALKSTGLSSLAGLAGFSGVSKRTSVDLTRDLLKDRDLLDSVAAEFDFVKRYEITENPKTNTRKMISDHLELNYNELSGVLEISYVDTDREFATRVVARIVELLSAEFKRLTLDKVAQKRAYLEHSVAVQVQKSDEVAAAYITFQRTYGVLDVATQASELSRSMSSVQSELTSKVLELRVAEQYYPATDVRIVKLKAEIEQLQALQRSVREGSDEFSTGGVSQKDLPELSVRYLTLKRDMEIQQTVLSLLKQQLELARLEELDTSGIFQVVDEVELPEKKDRPRRSLIAVVAVFAGGCLGILAAFTARYFEHARADPAEVETFQSIRKSLEPRRRRKLRRK